MNTLNCFNDRVNFVVTPKLTDEKGKTILYAVSESCSCFTENIKDKTSKLNILI